VKPLVALVGIAEKGYVTVELTTAARGGHSSMPPRRGAVGRLAAAVARIEETPMPARLGGAGTALFPHVGQDLPFGQRAAFANLWLTRPVVARALAGQPSTNAAIRTTAAPTIFQAGTKENVLPSRARAVVNFRILPGDSVAGVLAHVRRVVDDGAVRIRVMEEMTAAPSPVSPVDGAPYRMLARAVRQARPGVVVAPYLVVGATDARHYAALSPHVFRFLPVRMTGDDLARMHGTDERISVKEYEEAIRFYRLLLTGVASR
jgi:carboxypeptidase PM20D1